jgi:hypothetical protein
MEKILIVILILQILILIAMLVMIYHFDDVMTKFMKLCWSYTEPIPSDQNKSKDNAKIGQAEDVPKIIFPE